MMKITKTQLKQIIKEELDSALEESEIDENMLKKIGATAKKVGLDAMAGLGIGGELERRRAANPNYGLSKTQIRRNEEREALEQAKNLMKRSYNVGSPETLRTQISDAIRRIQNLQRYKNEKLPELEMAKTLIKSLQQKAGGQSTSSAFSSSDRFSETLTRIVREEIEAVLAEAADPQSFVGTLDQLPDSVIGDDVPGADDYEDDQKRELCKKAGVIGNKQMKDCLRVGLERWEKSYKGQYRSDRPMGKHAYDVDAGQEGRISVNQMGENKQ